MDFEYLRTQDNKYEGACYAENEQNHNQDLFRNLLIEQKMEHHQEKHYQTYSKTDFCGVKHYIPIHQIFISVYVKDNKFLLMIVRKKPFASKQLRKVWSR